MRDAGVKLGFLISPSVDGELGAMLVRRAGGEVIRGSSSYTGARALRDYYQALAHEGISPAITPDGPRGPPWKFKPGAILLSQLSQRPIIPMAYAASHAWKIKWDRFVIPMPGARIAIVVGEPVYVGERPGCRGTRPAAGGNGAKVAGAVRAGQGSFWCCRAQALRIQLLSLYSLQHMRESAMYVSQQANLRTV